MRHHRRNPISRRDAAIVGGIAAASAVAAAFAGAEPTGGTVTDALVTGGLAAFVTWASASAPWWALAVAGGVALGLSGDPVLGVVALVATLGAFAVGWWRENLPWARALIGGLATQVLLRAEVGGEFGQSAMIAGAVFVLLAIAGVTRRRHRVRRRVLWGAAGVAAFAVVAAVGLGITALNASSDLREGDAAAREGLELVRDGDPDAAAVQLEVAARALDKAKAKFDQPWARSAELVPFLGQHQRAARELSSLGSRVARTASEALIAIDIDRLGASAGQIDLAAVRELEQPFDAVADAVERLDAGLQRARTPWLVDPVDSRLERLGDQAYDVNRTASLARDALDVLPAMLGADGPRRYFIAFTTPAESRGLGGFMGNWAELTFDDGKAELTASGRTIDLNQGGPDPNRRRVTGSPDFIERYARYGLAVTDDGYAAYDVWSTLTMSPDFPSVAQTMAQLYPQSGGREVDGVIVVDPYALAGLLRLVGTVDIPGVGELNANNAVQFLLVDQYRDDNNPERIEMLEALSQATVRRVLTADVPPPDEVGEVMAPLAAEGHLGVWAARPEEQAILVRSNLDGSMPTLDGGDGLALTIANGGANKMDTYLRRALTYRAVVDPSTGQGRATLDVTLENQVPDDAPPAVIESDYVPRGVNRPIIAVYTSMPPVAVTHEGKPLRHRVQRELGWYVTSFGVDVAAGTSETISLELEGTLDRPEPYRFVFRPQPLATPEKLSLETLTPAGRTSMAYVGETKVPLELR